MYRKTVAYFRNFVFGVEDSLVSTVGLLSGVAVADVPRRTILLTGVVLICVEAFSMGVGSFLSERSAEEYTAESDIHAKNASVSAVIMFFSYFIAGFIPLAPYVFFSAYIAFSVSIALSLLSLFLLGIVSAYISRVHLLKDGLRMFVIGGAAIAIGVLVGKLLVLSNV